LGFGGGLITQTPVARNQKNENSYLSQNVRLMTDLTRLSYSLTKFGAYKIAFLLNEYSSKDILSHLGNQKIGSIDEAQVRKVLSISKDRSVPNLWSKVKEYGIEDIFDVVYVSLIISHHKLIEIISDSYRSGNTVSRKDFSVGIKPYTNFFRASLELGFVVDYDDTKFSFDLSRIFHKGYMPELISELLHLKLSKAGWDRQNSIIDESLRVDLNNVFGLSAEDFGEWLSGNYEDVAEIVKRPKRNYATGINFVEGHKPKYEGSTVSRKISKRQVSTLNHNRIQTRVYNILINQFPQDTIGTEVSTNFGSVDIVRKTKSSLIFYEIKTASSIRISIRQALSQLLEYAYWNDIPDIEELIIVAPNPISDDARYFLTKLRSTFNIPIFYQHYDEDLDLLSSKI